MWLAAGGARGMRVADEGGHAKKVVSPCWELPLLWPPHQKSRIYVAFGSRAVSSWPSLSKPFMRDQANAAYLHATLSTSVVVVALREQDGVRADAGMLPRTQSPVKVISYLSTRLLSAGDAVVPPVSKVNVDGSSVTVTPSMFDRVSKAVCIGPPPVKSLICDSIRQFR